MNCPHEAGHFSTPQSAPISPYIHGTHAVMQMFKSRSGCARFLNLFRRLRSDNTRLCPNVIWLGNCVTTVVCGVAVVILRSSRERKTKGRSRVFWSCDGEDESLRRKERPGKKRVAQDQVQTEEANRSENERQSS